MILAQLTSMYFSMLIENSLKAFIVNNQSFTSGYNTNKQENPNELVEHPNNRKCIAYIMTSWLSLSYHIRCISRQTVDDGSCAMFSSSSHTC